MQVDNEYLESDSGDLEVIQNDAPETPDTDAAINEIQDAALQLLESIQHAPASFGLQKESQELIHALNQMKTGVIDFSVFLQKQPSANDLRYPARADVLIKRARQRLHKSKYSFPDPKQFLTVVSELLKGKISSQDYDEIRTRLIYPLTRIDLRANGALISAMMRRSIFGSDQNDLIHALKAFLVNARAQSLPETERVHGR